MCIPTHISRPSDALCPVLRHLHGSKKRNSTKHLLRTVVRNPLHLHDVRCQPPLQPSRSPPPTHTAELGLPVLSGPEAHVTAEC